MKIDEFLKKIEPTLFLAIITAASYSIAYCYKLGYLSYFGVPDNLVEANIKDLAQELIIISIFLIFLVFLVLNVESLFLHKDIKVFLFYLIIFLSTFLAFLNWLVGDKFFNGSMAITTIFVIICLLTLKKGKYFLTFLLIFILAIYLTIIIGSQSAADTKNFTIITVNKNQYVLISTYKGKALVAPVNIANKTFKPEYQLMELESKGKIHKTITSINIGQLKKEE
jgi:hypothetical protein